MLKLEQIEDIDIKKETFKDVEGRRWRKTRAMSFIAGGAYDWSTHAFIDMSQLNLLLCSLIYTKIATVDTENTK